MRTVQELEEIALWGRRKVLEMAVKADSGHVSTAMSQMEILVSLYFGGILRYDPKNPQWDGRDIFILSKGQGGIGLYPLLSRAGFFPLSDLDNFTGPGSKIGVHAESHCPGVEILSGSLGHGLPIATGIALALKNAGSDRLVFCLVGDGELQEGSNWEALMFAAHHKLGNLIVIVDRNGQNTLGRTDGDTPRDGPGLEDLRDKAKAFGCYSTPVAGHDVGELVSFFEEISDARQNNFTRPPWVIIANTKKGKGLPIEDKRDWHYKVPSDEILEECWKSLGGPEWNLWKCPACGYERVLHRSIPGCTCDVVGCRATMNKAGIPVNKSQRKHDKGMRDRFFDVLYEYFKADKNKVIVVADNGAASLDKFATDLPQQYYQVGIAEQQMVGLATGLAKMGKKVWCYAIAPFVTTRVHEFLKLDCCAMNLPICMVGVGAGYAYDIMGPTHHTVEDIAIMRCLPNMTIWSPCDGVSAEAVGHVSAKLMSPHYVRLDRGGLPDLFDDFILDGRGMSGLRDSKSKLLIVSTGIMTHQALKVADRIDAEVLDVLRLKPFNQRLFEGFVAPNDAIVTLEEHQLNGGLGSIVAETLADYGIKLPLLRIGVPDKFTFTLGGREEIWKEHGLDVETIVTRIKEWKRD